MAPVTPLLAEPQKDDFLGDLMHVIPYNAKGKSEISQLIHAKRAGKLSQSTISYIVETGCADGPVQRPLPTSDAVHMEDNSEGYLRLSFTCPTWSVDEKKRPLSASWRVGYCSFEYMENCGFELLLAEPNP